MNKTTRHFEFKDDKSSKFWEITQTSAVVTVRYGKTGTNGQSQDKAFTDATAAGKHVGKLIAEKLGKGYVEQGSASVTGAEAPAAPGVLVEKAPKPGAESEAKKVPVKAVKAQPVKSTKPKNPAQDPDAAPESLMARLDKDDATNRLLAKHLRANAELLEKLSHSSDQATRRAVAGNPNTPQQIYVRLGQQFPKEFLANPMLDLLLMENPALMDEVPEALLNRLLKQADCPASLLTWAAAHDHEKVQLAVAMNANAPQQALQLLRQSKHPTVCEAVRHTPSTFLEEDPEIAFEKAVRERLGSMTSKELYVAWKARDVGLAQWSALPLTFRLAKSTNSDEFSPEAIARVLQKTQWTLEAIREVLPSYAYWDEVACDSVLPIVSLRQLAGDLDAWVREGVARNPSAPVDLLETLAKDSDYRVRRVVARHPRTPQHVLEALAQDPDTCVMREAASRIRLFTVSQQNFAKVPNHSEDLPSGGHHAVLAQEELDEIVQPAQLEGDLVKLILQPNLSSKRAESIADNLLSTPPLRSAWYQRELTKASAELRAAAQADAILSYQGKDPNEAVLTKRAVGPLMALCAGLVIEPSRLVKVVGSTDWLVRAAVARNPGTPPNLIKKLRADAHPLVAALAGKAQVGATGSTTVNPRSSKHALEPTLTVARS